MTRFVYFIGREDGEGPVKIGCSAVPTVRLSQLMAWAPYKLAVLATLPGDSELERRFHAAFREQHSHREWFTPSDALSAVIAAVLAGTFDTNVLPAPRGLYSGRLGVKVPAGQILRQRLSRSRHFTGIDAPSALEALARDFDSLGPQMQQEARARIEAHLADPRAAGVLLPYPWALKAYATYAARHGWPPLALAAA